MFWASKRYVDYINSRSDPDDVDRFGRFCYLYHVVWISVLIHGAIGAGDSIPIAWTIHAFLLSFLFPAFGFLIRDDCKWKEFICTKNEDKYKEWKLELEETLNKIDSYERSESCPSELVSNIQKPI